MFCRECNRPKMLFDEEKQAFFNQGAMQNLNIIVLFPNFTVEPIQVYVTYK